MLLYIIIVQIDSIEIYVLKKYKKRETAICRGIGNPKKRIKEYKF
jgi:hypothetical protein